MPEPEAHLLHELIQRAAALSPAAAAVVAGRDSLDYARLGAQVHAVAGGLVGLALARTDRVGIWLEKRLETVVASFAAPAAGGVMVPMNPLLKPEQVLYIARDCNVRILVTSPERLALLAPLLADCPDLRSVVQAGVNEVMRHFFAAGPEVPVPATGQAVPQEATAGYEFCEEALLGKLS